MRIPGKDVPILPNQLNRPETEFASDTAPSTRQLESPLLLLAHAIGGPRQIASKLARMGATLALAANPFEYRRRLRKLRDKGLVRCEKVATGGRPGECWFPCDLTVKA